MRQALRTVLAIIAVIAGALLVPASAVADKPPFVVVNAASFQGGAVSGGALWAIYTQDRVSPEQHWVYQPWTPTPRYGLWIEASCGKRDDFATLPVLYVGFAYGGNQINVYKPNAMGTEPWGSCPYTGPTVIRIHTASGAVLEEEVVLLPAHPGIFTIGEAPAGDHVDKDGNHTALSDCPAKIRLNPKACSVLGELWVFLTGAEWFTCDPCAGDGIRFELASSPNAPDADWVPQPLRRLATTSTGVEQAMIQLRPDSNPGVHYLRVRNTFRPEYPMPLRVELGQPG